MAIVNKKFVVGQDTEVRHAPSSASIKFHDLKAGQTVEVLDKPRQLPDGTIRVPIEPRGWVNAECLVDFPGCSPSSQGAAGVMPNAEDAWRYAQEEAEAMAAKPTPARGSGGWAKYQQGPVGGGKNWVADGDAWSNYKPSRDQREADWSQQRWHSQGEGKQHTDWSTDQWGGSQSQDWSHDRWQNANSGWESQNNEDQEHKGNDDSAQPEHWQEEATEAQAPAAAEAWAAEVAETAEAEEAAPIRGAPGLEPYDPGSSGEQPGWAAQDSGPSAQQAEGTVLVASCEGTTNAMVRHLIGDYHKLGKNHDRPTFQKVLPEGSQGLPVLLYYWDERDGEDNRGWWFGQEVGGDQVWAYSLAQSGSPPTSGWHIPFDNEEVHASFTLAAKVEQDDTAQDESVQDGTWNPNAEGTVQDATWSENAEDTAQPRNAQEGTAQEDTAQPRNAQEGTAQDATWSENAEDTAQPRNAQEGTAQDATWSENAEDTAQPSNAQEGTAQDGPWSQDAEDTAQPSNAQEGTAQDAPWSQDAEGTTQDATWSQDAGTDQYANWSQNADEPVLQEPAAPARASTQEPVEVISSEDEEEAEIYTASYEGDELPDEIMRIIRTIEGDYTESVENHGCKTFKRQIGTKSLSIYYWDDRDGEESQGWYIGPEIGGDEVFTFSAEKSWTPPAASWHIPFTDEQERAGFNVHLKGSVDEAFKKLEEESQDACNTSARSSWNGHGRHQQSRENPLAAHDPWAKGAKEDPLAKNDPWSSKAAKQAEDPLAKHDPWASKAAGKENGWGNRSANKGMGKGDDPLAKNDPWTGNARGKGEDPLARQDPWAARKATAKGEDPLAAQDPWARNASQNAALANKVWEAPGLKADGPWQKSINKAMKDNAQEQAQSSKGYGKGFVNGGGEPKDPLQASDPWASQNGHGLNGHANGKAHRSKELQADAPPFHPPAERRELQPWQHEGVALPPGISANLDLDQRWQGQQWNQFEANERQFGIRSTYNEALYTTQLDHGTVSAERRAQAYGRALAPGSSQFETRDGLSYAQESEEARFSAVGKAQTPLSAEALAALNESIADHIHRSQWTQAHTEAEFRIRSNLEAILKKLGHEGEVKVFGSSATSFKSAKSDLDATYTGDLENGRLLATLASVTQSLKDRYENVTKVFTSSTPLVKFTDPASLMEVDFCMHNDLGIRNSKLLESYCRCDHRVPTLGRLVKDWAKRFDMVSSTDGCLNSYAYVLMSLYYLQWVQPCVIPNLQQMDAPSHPIADTKRGVDDRWETKFFDQVEQLPPSENKSSVAELLYGFFQFYSEEFDWSQNAVCIRAGSPGGAINKYGLNLASFPEQWYIEDPFDLKHNLGAKCSRQGKDHILQRMQRAMEEMRAARLPEVVGPPPERSSYFLRCRTEAHMSPQALMDEFRDHGLVRLHFPNSGTQAFLEFATARDRRRAHAKNEGYADSCQLMLIPSNEFGLSVAKQETTFTVHNASGGMAWQ